MVFQLRFEMALWGVGDLRIDFVFHFVFVLGFLDALLDGLESRGARLVFCFMFRLSLSGVGSFRFAFRFLPTRAKSFRFRFVLKRMEPKRKTKKYATVSF